MKKNYNPNFLVKQRYGSDCGVACISMFTGESYEKVEYSLIRDIKKKTKPIDGMDSSEIAIALKNFGFNPMIVYTLIHGLKAIISVPSTNNRLMFHLVFWDGYNIYDPSSYDPITTTEFLEKFPLSDCIICKDEAGIILNELPSHFKNEFDKEYLKKLEK